MNPFTRPQTTLANSVSVSGFGFWSGKDVRLTFAPAESNSGIVFVRTDLPGSPEIPAGISHHIDGPRRTTLLHRNNSVEMVEHVLAALAGLKIDNCEVRVDAKEMPGFDGSSKTFTDALAETEIVMQTSTRDALIVTSKIRVGNDQSWIQAEPAAKNELELAYHLNYACRSIGTQSFQTIVTPEIFREQISPARTFLLEQEALQLRDQGLGLRVGYHDVLVFNDDGPIDNQLRFDNECPRHKLLDMIGDFSLCGMDLIGKFTACRSGHRLNSEMVHKLIQRFSKHRNLPMSA